jgi:hypothetical protein
MFVAQRIEHPTTDQKVGGSSPSERASPPRLSRLGGSLFLFDQTSCPTDQL